MINNLEIISENELFNNSNNDTEENKKNQKLYLINL